MAKSPLFGRRIHIAGSVPDDAVVAPTSEVQQAQDLVAGLVKELVRRGVTFVVPVDAEKLRAADGQPICFDWLVWKTIQANLIHRPSNAPNPLAVAVQHHKNEEQIPKEFEGLWDDLRNSDLVQIESAAQYVCPIPGVSGHNADNLPILLGSQMGACARAAGYGRVMAAACAGADDCRPQVRATRGASWSKPEH